MKAREKTDRASGFTLIEMLVAMGIFSILMTVLFSTFSSISNHVSELSDKQALMQKGQRALDYIGEEFRLAGLFVGARPAITFCGEATVDSLQHTDGVLNADKTSYDTVTFLTSERITTTKVNVPFLITSANAVIADTTLKVNAPTSDVLAITPTNTPGTVNARAFITLDTLQPNLGTLVYQVTAYGVVAGNNTLTITPALDQNINAQSNVYSVVRKQFAVNTTTAPRTLQLVLRDSDCGTNPDPIVSSYGPGNANGGVDGFQVEYTLADGTALSALAAPNIVNVRSITIWILMRSDFPAKSYRNTTTYTLGSAVPVPLGPFNDNYRRVLLTKTVEVKNVSL